MGAHFYFWRISVKEFKGHTKLLFEMKSMGYLWDHIISYNHIKPRICLLSAWWDEDISGYGSSETSKEIVARENKNKHLWVWESEKKTYFWRGQYMERENGN